jgi:hypothetical protein
MHSPELSLETLEHVWSNYHILGEHVDLQRMPPDRLDALIEQRAAARPFQLAAWVATQGFFVSAWAIWEYHSRLLCQGLPNRLPDRGRSHVQWVAETLGMNGRLFAESTWFAGANALRNLIAHHGARAVGERAEALLVQARSAFARLEVDPEGYMLIDSEHAAELKWKIAEFIRQPSMPA